MPNRRSRALAALTALVVIGLLASTAEPAQQSARQSAQQSARQFAHQPEQRRTPRAPPVTGSATLGPALGEQTRPNIVVIMADDMREDDLRFMPRTRALLGDQGVRFANSFSPHPMCCPARASFVTGKYTHNHGVWSNRGAYGGFHRLDDSDTMPVALSAVGYDTVFLGKYLNGYGLSPLPDGSPSETYVPPGWTDWRGSARRTYQYFQTTLNINGTLRANPGWYQTRMLGAETEDILSAQARSPRPFFLWASYIAPHIGKPPEKDDPLPVERTDGAYSRFPTPAVPADVRGMFDETITRAPGQDGEDDVSDKPFYLRNLPQIARDELASLAEVVRQRAESLEVLDREVELTVDALDRTGELDDTVLMFTADNGYFLGEHRIRQGKLLPYEPALRVPLLVRGPGIPAGEVRNDPVLSIDFAPTFLELSGAQPDPAHDGQSFLDPARPSDLTHDSGWDRVILTETGPRKLKKVTRTGTLPPGADAVRFTQGARTRRYLYVEHATGERELYDQRSDPGQLDSIVEDRRAEPIVEKMAALLARLRDCAGEECRAPSPHFVDRLTVAGAERDRPRRNGSGRVRPD
ncbi:MAG: sulfatase [Actinomycetota bacterium]|nr:sulfatase [Actinomycetota bacterium]